jgi:predicted HicB family RNase H-like nuclease
MMEYKGYIAKVEFDDESIIFHGEVINLRDVITFEADCVDGLLQAFHDSVDDYLDFCKERGEDPERPFSGKFLVRLDTDLHRKIYIKAQLENKSLNAWVSEALESVLSREKERVTADHVSA